MSEKVCNKCKELLPAAAFNRNRHTTDHLEGQCKTCKRSVLASVEEPTVLEKQCSKCKEVKQASAFDRYKRTQDGLQSQCKACMKVSVLIVPVPTSAHVCCVIMATELCRKCLRQAARPTVTIPTVEQKQCSKCHVVKGAADFFRREQSHDGLQSWCRACKNAARQGNVSTHQALQHQSYADMSDGMGGAGTQCLALCQGLPV